MKKQRQTKLVHRISGSFILLVTIAFGLVLGITSYSTFRILNREYALRLTQQLRDLTDDLNQTINNVYQIHEKIQNDQKLKTAIDDWYEAQTDGAFLLEGQAFDPENLMRVKSLSTLINCVYLYDQSMELVDSYDYNKRSEDFLMALSEEVRDFSGSGAYRQFINIEDSIFYLCSLFEAGNYHYNAYIALEISRDRLFFRCFSGARKLFPDIHVTDGEYWLAELGEALEGEPQTLINASTTHRGSRPYLVFCCVSGAYPAWMLVGLYDQTILLKDIMRQICPLLIIFLVTILAVILISVRNVLRITRPLEELSASMQHLEQGEYPPPLPVTGTDEVGTMIEGYNHLIRALEQLHQNLVNEQREKRKIAVASVNTRLQLLQSQINPHFIYNTLNTMNYMATEAGNTELADLIFSFGSLLRSSISVESDFVPVHTEIDSVKYYLQIQTHRYADVIFSCIYAVDPETEDLLLPRMILQPLVENSLIHGILPGPSGQGTIRIRCSVRDEYLYIYVSDDGIGIPPEKLEKMRNGELKMSNGYNHIGLNNVRERIEILYQQECQFQIISREGQGTVISFRVPVKKAQ